MITLRRTSRLRSDLVQTFLNRLSVDVAVSLFQYFRLQQRYVALLEVDDDRAGDVLTLVRTHSHHRRQTPLTFTHRKRRRNNAVSRCVFRKNSSTFTCDIST